MLKESMWQYADLILRSATVTLLLFLAVVLMARERASWPARLGALLAVTVACHLICPWIAHDVDLGIVEYPVFFGCFAVPVAFWVFSRAVFNEKFSLRITDAAALLIVEAAAFTRLWLGPAIAEESALIPPIATGLLQLPSLVLIIVVLMRVWSGMAADLVEKRLRLRRILVTGVGFYMTIVIAVEIAFRGQPAPSWLSASHAALALAVTVWVALNLLQTARGVLSDARGEPSPAPSPADAALAEKLVRSMEQDRTYLTEGLTIRNLATMLGEQEYRLRRVINGQLQFRNFNDFVNQYRIREACTRLADPAEARLPVLSIALDLGFRSLGPFNRTFKEATGQTPSDYRRANRSGSSTP